MNKNIQKKLLITRQCLLVSGKDTICDAKDWGKCGQKLPNNIQLLTRCLPSLPQPHLRDFLWTSDLATSDHPSPSELNLLMQNLDIYVNFSIKSPMRYTSFSMYCAPQGCTGASVCINLQVVSGGILYKPECYT